MPEETVSSPAERRRQKRELRRTGRRTQAAAAKSSQQTSKAIKWGIVALLVGAAIFFVARAASQASAAAPKEKFPYGTVHWHQITLGQYFKAINYPFSDTQLGKYKNGDPCPDGQPGTVKVIVDGQHSGVKSDLVLRDGKSIRVEFSPG